MAFEQTLKIASFNTTSTGLAQYRFVTVNASGNVVYPAAGASAIGVLQSGTTGSTVKPRAVSVAVAGISKLAVSTASTIATPDLVMSSSRGSAVAMTAAGIVAGQVVQGTSGGAGRVVHVLIAGVNASTATV